MATTRFIHFFTTSNISENGALFCWRRAVLEGNVQNLGRQEIYSDVLKSALLFRYVIHALKFVLTRWEDLCPHAADGAVSHELRFYQITV